MVYKWPMMDWSWNLMTVPEIKDEIEKKEKALLVGFYHGNIDKNLCKEHLDELAFLAKTFGIDDHCIVAVPLRKPDSATYMGSGKMEELALLAQEEKVDLIIIDDEISPAQQRNLEKAFQLPVMERTEVILGVFAQRAQTKEARLQVELAQSRYQKPRLKKLWTHLSRQRGGSANQKGEGEKQIEIDKRLLNKRIDKLERGLKEVRLQRQIQRHQRQRLGIPTFAIIGYTNAGKSTLLNALTDAHVFVEDKLFATVDTATRKFMMPNNQEILLIDTVGFIRKIPHTLVAAFKSTLEESIQTDILLHIIDGSHPMAHEHTQATMDVLKELGAVNKPIITVLNKIDKCAGRAIIDRLRILFPGTLQISALNKEGFDVLISTMQEELAKQRQIIDLRIPQKDYHLVSEVLRESTLINQDYIENDVLLKVECPLRLVGRLETYRIIEESDKEIKKELDEH